MNGTSPCSNRALLDNGLHCQSEAINCVHDTAREGATQPDVTDTATSVATIAMDRENKYLRRKDEYKSDYMGICAGGGCVQCEYGLCSQNTGASELQKTRGWRGFYVQ